MLLLFLTERGRQALECAPLVSDRCLRYGISNFRPSAWSMGRALRVCARLLAASSLKPPGTSVSLGLHDREPLSVVARALALACLYPAYQLGDPLADPAHPLAEALGAFGYFFLFNGVVTGLSGLVVWVRARRESGE